ncbi:glycoside hydrolase family 75 protein [Kutzneria viridogrisea]|uniref:Secreted protein n=2 Tax=Kutzneria TaxID=43356 RepID=W5WF01_9PSEU|nr:glycoside hydrolase family 75 protein [Kutzneria albida]AHH99783.1 hypothetical protein KALB_6424 [Kutzneria albida DSM 43870]MBA8924960.1 hypothetical protein [Kutzneria viridogrisea]
MSRSLSVLFAAVICVLGGSTAHAAAAPPTAAQLLAKVTGCNQVSHGKYRKDESSGSATVAVCGKKGGVFWKADMDIDCDGQPSTHCSRSTDPDFQAETAFNDSHGKALRAETLPYVVVPGVSSIWNYRDSGIRGGTVVAVIYDNKLTYAVVGDVGPAKAIGEASYATAKSLGIDPNPRTGGVDSGVTYIALTGALASPIESHDSAVAKGQAAAARFLTEN